MYKCTYLFEYILYKIFIRNSGLEWGYVETEFWRHYTVEMKKKNVFTLLGNMFLSELKNYNLENYMVGLI